LEIAGGGGWIARLQLGYGEVEVNGDEFWIGLQGSGIERDRFRILFAAGEDRGEVRERLGGVWIRREVGAEGLFGGGEVTGLKRALAAKELVLRGQEQTDGKKSRSQIPV
jgi:hypothetical protein